MEKSLKKIRKKQEACFGKDLQVIRNSFFKPNTYTHFKNGIYLYQKINLICKSSKFKKIVFAEFKDEIKEGLELLNLNEKTILEIKHSWEITQLWTRLKSFRSDAKKWYELIIETEKYNLPPNSDQETVKKAREKAVKKELKIKLKKEQEKELAKQKEEEERKKETEFKKELKFTKERQLKIAQKKVLTLQQKNKELLDEKKYLKTLYSKVLKKISFSNTKDVLNRRSILCECNFRNDFYKIKIKIDKFWEEKIEKSILISAFSKVLDTSEDKLKIYYLGVDDEYEFNIDEYIREKVNSLEKWTLIEKNHSEYELGNIYVLSNKSLPNTFKIGFTSKNPDLRAKNIMSSLKMSSKFVVEQSWVTKNPFEVEQKIFNSLSKYRDGKSEFFKCDLKRIFSTIERHIQKID